VNSSVSSVGRSIDDHFDEYFTEEYFRGEVETTVRPNSAEEQDRESNPTGEDRQDEKFNRQSCFTGFARWFKLMFLHSNRNPLTEEKLVRRAATFLRERDLLSDNDIAVLGYLYLEYGGYHKETPAFRTQVTKAIAKRLTVTHPTLRIVDAQSMTMKLVNYYFTPDPRVVREHAMLKTELMAKLSTTREGDLDELNDWQKTVYGSYFREVFVRLGLIKGKGTRIRQNRLDAITDFRNPDEQASGALDGRHVEHAIEMCDRVGFEVDHKTTWEDYKSRLTIGKDGPSPGHPIDSERDQ
jgi:phage terminase small subunit